MSINIENISLVSEKVILEKINFSATKGDIIGLVGHNGSGKTTLCKVIAGLICSTSGEINVLGYNPFQLKKTFRRKIALQLPNQSIYWNNVPCSESLLLHGLMYGLSKKTVGERIRKLSNELKITNLMKRLYRFCSFGERGLLNLAASLLHQPELLVLDEPTVGLDSISHNLWINCLRNYIIQTLPTIILSSHLTRDIELLCNVKIELRQGRLINFERIRVLHDVANA